MSLLVIFEAIISCKLKFVILTSCLYSAKELEHYKRVRAEFEGNDKTAASAPPSHPEPLSNGHPISPPHQPPGLKSSRHRDRVSRSSSENVSTDTARRHATNSKGKGKQKGKTNSRGESGGRDEGGEDEEDDDDDEEAYATPNDYGSPERRNGLVEH